MANLDNTQKAPLLIDGAQWNADTPGVTSSDPAIASLGPGPDGKFYVFGQAEGVASINVNFAGRTGSLSVTVTSAPYTLTLGAAEPK